MKDIVFSYALKKLPEEKQKAIINTDISMIAHATPQVQQVFLNQDFNRYSLYVSDEAKEPFLNPEAHTNKDQSVVQKSYSGVTDSITGEKETSTSILMTKGGAKKEVDINNKLRALFSYAEHNDTTKVNEEFKTLCLACCQCRFKLTGNKYSVDIKSAQWLIKIISAEDRNVEHLINILGIYEHEKVLEKIVKLKSILGIKDGKDVQDKVECIVNEKNLALRSEAVTFRDTLSGFKKSDSTLKLKR